MASREQGRVCDEEPSRMQRLSQQSKSYIIGAHTITPSVQAACGANDRLSSRS